MYKKKTITEIVKAIKKQSFRTNGGTGPVVVYPDELLMELFDENVINDICFETEVPAVAIGDIPGHPLNAKDNPAAKEQLGFIEQLEKLADL